MDTVKRTILSVIASGTIATLIRRPIFAAFIFLLTGCPGPGDRIVPRESTSAVVKDNDICVISTLNPGEEITAVQISSDKGSLFHKIFDEQPIYVASGECLPLFGLTFTPGKKYFIAYDVQSGQTEHHLLMVELAVEADSCGQSVIR